MDYKVLLITVYAPWRTHWVEKVFSLNLFTALQKKMVSLIYLLSLHETYETLAHLHTLYTFTLTHNSTVLHKYEC